MSTGDNLLERVQAGLGAQALETGMAHGILVLQITAENVVPVAGRLKQEFGFDLFLDVTATDWPQRQPRAHCFGCPRAPAGWPSRWRWRLRSPCMPSRSCSGVTAGLARPITRSRSAASCNR